MEEKGTVTKLSLADVGVIPHQGVGHGGIEAPTDGHNVTNTIGITFSGAFTGGIDPDEFLTFSYENACVYAECQIGYQHVLEHYRKLKETEQGMSSELQSAFCKVMAHYMIFLTKGKVTPLQRSLREFDEILKNEVKYQPE